ncbi:FAD-dependent oxidoreductase [Tessaracoccus sp. MC1679]|uniref:FAD-dependent oxidoreductase n=1 Tax=Tessaracoccus sp. MC1679 TaxID=2760313 RepID=UPI0015FEC2A7|nr:FAD-dependent oxidoreductase [Tessaracoccus sp. MC1679]MBB1516567.1 FAD-dependent oxidoreductase [Tessaracoccus sp. MC1679]
MSDPFDVAILGAGSAGYACALRAAQLGLRVALVDDTALGGTCLHRGCIPTKAWLQAAKVRRTVAKAPSFGIGATLGETDAGGILRYAEGVVGGLHRGLESLISQRGITVIRERGTLTVDERGPGIETGAIVHRARAVVVATGAAPVTLGLAVDGVRILTSDHALRLESLPERAVVLGGGVIGVEFASLWADLGVAVTLVEAMDRLLPAEEPGHSRILARALKGRGVDVRLGVAVDSAEATDDGVAVRIGGETLHTELLLVAVGRRPATDGMGLAESGVEIGPGGHLVVDEHLQTRVKGVFAAGDVVAGPQLAHRGYTHGIFLAERIAHLQGRHHERPALPRDTDIPRVTYSSPQLASVGLTAAEAGPEADVVDYHLTGNGRAQILRAPGERETGVVRLVRRSGGAIVGMHAVGEDVAELIAEGSLLVGWNATPEDLAGIVHPHPTLSEAIAEANWALAGRALHMHA